MPATNPKEAAINWDQKTQMGVAKYLAKIPQMRQNYALGLERFWGVSPGSATIEAYNASVNGQAAQRLAQNTQRKAQQGLANWFVADVGVDAPPPCPADLDGDGTIAVPDLLLLLAVWGLDPGGPPDFDGDGAVAVPDLLLLLAAWGPCPS